METKYFLVLFSLIFFVGLVFSVPLTECQEITEAGTYVLQNDINEVTDTCFNVNVPQCSQAYDCNDFTVDGEEICNAQGACNWNETVCENTSDCVIGNQVDCEGFFCAWNNDLQVTLDGNNHNISNQVNESGLGVIKGNAFPNLTIKNFNFVNDEYVIDLLDITGANNSILNNNFINCVYGISAQSADIDADLNFHVENNVFVDSEQIAGSPFFSQFMNGTTFSNNVFNLSGGYNNSVSPIAFMASPNTVFSGNTIRNNVSGESIQWVIFSSAPQFPSGITGNTMSNTTFRNFDGEIVFNETLDIPISGVSLDSGVITIDPNSVYVDSETLDFLQGASVTIGLAGLSPIQFPEVINDTSDCASCSTPNYSNGLYLFNATIGDSSETYSIQRHVFTPIDVPNTIFEFVGGSFAGIAGLAFVLIVTAILLVCVALLYDIFTGNLGLIELLKGQ